MNNLFSFSEDFIKKVTDLSFGYLSKEEIDRLFSLLKKESDQSYFTYASESNLLRIILSMFDRISFLQEIILYPHYAELLVTISVNSNYLTDIIVRNPSYFYWIVNPSNLNLKLELDKTEELIDSMLNSYRSFTAKLNALKAFKRREILRIGVKDLSKIMPFEETAKQLSILARSITKKLFDLCLYEIKAKYNLKDKNLSFCMASLGKLGGNELNYSSDIDVIIFYEEEKDLGKKFLSEILTEALYLFIESSSRATETGYLYRVDLRLRPDGKNSPLCRSINDYLNYYESRGELWERQMLIKLNYIAGDYSLFKRFETYLGSFIYPSSFLQSPTEQIRIIRERILKNITVDNIKLSSGGIRDIEFSVQVLQLINGGKNKDIRTGNTLNAIKKLSEYKILSPSEAGTLKEAYILFRMIEHFMQLRFDTQTHSLPKEEDVMAQLCNLLGFDGSASFNEKVNNLKLAVSGIFNSIMETDIISENGIAEIKFENKTKALKDLEFLREGKDLVGSRLFDTNSIEAFLKIQEPLIRYLNDCINPDRVLQNFVRVIKNIQLPSLWYSEFINTKFFKNFLYLCEYSQRSIDLFAEDKDLGEYFISKKVFIKLAVKNLELLSLKKLLFVLSVQFGLHLIDHERVSALLTKYINKRVLSTSEIFFEDEAFRGKYFIAAMGSFGSSGMTFTSDIDLIFVLKDLELFPEAQNRFQKYLQEIKKALKPFEVDCRLRPEGKSSTLVWDIDNYKKYIGGRARVWELQSYCKLSFISGNKSLFNELQSAVLERVRIEDCAVIKREIHEMHEKIFSGEISKLSGQVNLKKSPGSLTDIEFILQYLILCNNELFSICRGKSIIQIINILQSTADQRDLEQLKENYSYIKSIILAIQNIFNTSPIIPAAENPRKLLASFAGFKNPPDFDLKLLEVQKEIRDLYRKYLR